MVGITTSQEAIDAAIAAASSGANTPGNATPAEGGNTSTTDPSVQKTITALEEAKAAVPGYTELKDTITNNVTNPTLPTGTAQTYTPVVSTPEQTPEQFLNPDLTSPAFIQDKYGAPPGQSVYDPMTGQKIQYTAENGVKIPYSST